MKSTILEKREEITIKIIEALEEGTAPWQKPWINNRPMNAVTGNYYKGINAIYLSVEGDRLSREDDPRWATRKQAESEGWRIKKEAKAAHIYVLIIPENKFVCSGSLGKNFPVRNRKTAFRKTFEVYHASQIEGIPAYEKTEHSVVMSEEELDKIIFKSSARILEVGYEACYLPKSDVIKIPCRESFIDTESYYSTLLHELAHWTGHSSRLDRFNSWSTSTEDYAREELVAEIASMFLTVETGIEQTQEHFTNHVGYIDSWISLLKTDVNAIFKATQEAKRAADFLMAFKEEAKEDEKIA